MESLLPRVRIETDSQITLDPHRLFDGLCRDIVLEIGFGGGERLAAQATEHADTGYIGCEPFVNGVAKLLAEVHARRLMSNVRIFPGDARLLLPRLQAASFARIDLFYPDPWPKRRQHKRRFVSDESLRDLARLLQPGGEFRFATDIDDYAGWTLARVFRTRWFAWNPASAADWSIPWSGHVRTRYESKALTAGRHPTYLSFIRSDAAIS